MHLIQLTNQNMVGKTDIWEKIMLILDLISKSKKKKITLQKIKPNHVWFQKNQIKSASKKSNQLKSNQLQKNIMKSWFDLFTFSTLWKEYQIDFRVQQLSGWRFLGKNINKVVEKLPDGLDWQMRRPKSCYRVCVFFQNVPFNKLPYWRLWNINL